MKSALAILAALATMAHSMQIANFDSCIATSVDYDECIDCIRDDWADCKEDCADNDNSCQNTCNRDY